MPHASPTPSQIPLWPVPLLVALIPFAAAHLAYAISIDAGHVPGCVPYVEGCTSISPVGWVPHMRNPSLFAVFAMMGIAALHPSYAVLRRRPPRTACMGFGVVVFAALTATLRGFAGSPAWHRDCAGRGFTPARCTPVRTGPHGA
jgi:hypothetical protein